MNMILRTKSGPSLSSNQIKYTYEQAFEELKNLNGEEIEFAKTFEPGKELSSFEERFQFFQNTDFSRRRRFPTNQEHQILIQKFNSISEALKKLPKEFNSFTTISNVPASVTQININEKDAYKSVFETIAAEILQNQRGLDIQDEKDINTILSQCKSKFLA